MFLPQMSPMWWTSLSMMFYIAIFTCMYLMYFNYEKKMTGKKSIIMKEMNWKW